MSLLHYVRNDGCIWFWVLGFGYLVLGTWFWVLGFWFLVLGSWFWVFGNGLFVLTVRFMLLIAR